MTVDLSGLPRHVTVAVGDRAEIPLPSYAGSGNFWSVTDDLDGKVARVAVAVEAPKGSLEPGNGTAEPPPMTLATERVVVEGLGPGEGTWRLVLARSFGSPTPIAEHDLRVRVVEHG
jgi:hypothetical protein